MASDPESSRQANKWLNKFYVNEYANQISLELLEYGTPENQLLGVIILEHQLKFQGKQINCIGWPPAIYSFGSLKG